MCRMYGLSVIGVLSALPARLELFPRRVAMHAPGKPAGGEPVMLQGLWFEQKSAVCHALPVARKIRVDVAESFAGALRLR